jgi:beta-galactosidase
VGTSLDVLVDTMGHVNYGPRLGKDQKGLIGQIWDMRGLVGA